MDIKIENKDTVLDDSFNPVTISGIQQAVQQLNIAASINKGSFIYDRSCGNEIYKQDFDDERIVKTVQTLLNESLVNVADVSVKVNNIRDDGGIKYADVTISDKYENIDTEVMLNG